MELSYVARCDQTGEIWKTEDFKSLVHHVRYAFKMQAHDFYYYDVRSATLSLCVVYNYDGHIKYFKVRDIATIFVSGILGAVRCYLERVDDDEFKLWSNLSGVYGIMNS